MTLKETFMKTLETTPVPKVITVAVKLPSGAIETITNTQDTYTKVLYYKEMYDDEFKLKHNPEVQIVAFMIV